MSGPNREQARYWTDEGGPSWVRNERRYEGQLQPFEDALFDSVGDVAGRRVLDVGCGFGPTSLALAARGAQVTGIDISAPMIERARERAATVGVDAAFVIADAQEDALGGPHDLVVSRFGVMFFVDPTRAFMNIASSTRADGRLAFTCWQSLDRNPWLALPIEVVRSFDDDALSPNAAAASSPSAGSGVAGAPNPMAFAETEFVADMLANSGWTDVRFTSVEPLVHVGGHDGLEGAIELALNGSSVKVLLERGGPELRDRVRAELAERFAEHLVDGQVRMPSAAWLVTATRGDLR